MKPKYVPGTFFKIQDKLYMIYNWSYVDEVNKISYIVAEIKMVMYNNIEYIMINTVLPNVFEDEIVPYKDTKLLERLMDRNKYSLKKYDYILNTLYNYIDYGIESWYNLN